MKLDYAKMSRSLRGVLDRYRDPSGNVDYFALSADKGVVAFAESLADFAVDSLETREERLAFWINCYNALSIYGVIKKLKDDSSFAESGNSGWIGRVRFFAFQKFNVGGRDYTLRDIENHIRSEFEDPRIHFALNCSSMSCPVLKDGLYSAENLDEELEQAAKLYINSDRGAVLDKENKKLHLSMIFKWYNKDFKKTGKSVKEYVIQYIDEESAEFIKENKEDIKVEYMEYDWSLNITEDKEAI